MAGERASASASVADLQGQVQFARDVAKPSGCSPSRGALWRGGWASGVVA